MSVHRGSTLYRIDPATNEVVETLHVPKAGFDPFVVSLDGALWLKSSDTPRFQRIDVSSGASTMYTLPHWAPLPDFFDDPIVAGLGALWTRTSTSTVARIDPHTGQVVQTYPANASAGGGYLIVAVAPTGSDYQIRPHASQ